MSENVKVNSPITQDAFHTLITVLIGQTDWVECPTELKDKIIAIAHVNFLAGALYIRTRDERLQASWAQQRLEAMLAMEHLEMFESKMQGKGVRLTRIKGASLIPQFYPDWGFRHLCDVDILLAEKDLSIVEDELSMMGFIYQPVVQWKAASYRRSWMRRHETGMPLSLDLHTRLLWDQELELDTYPIDHEGTFWRLTNETELLHLIVNWVEQDTCISFSKMYDIFTVISQGRPLNWQQWMNRPEVSRHWRAILIVKVILKEYFAYNWSVEIPYSAPFLQKILRRSFRQNFFAEPRAHSMDYFLFKHLTKSLRSALVYDILWGVAHAGDSASLLVKGNR